MKEQFEKLLRDKDNESIKEFIEAGDPADMAELLEEHPPETASGIIALVDADCKVDLVEQLDLADQVDLIKTLTPRDAAKIIERMASDDRADLVGSLPENLREKIMAMIPQEERDDITRLMSFEEGTAGSIMTTDYAAVEPDITVQEAIDILRLVAPDAETIYYVYVTDATGTLMGLVSLRYLIFSPPKKKIRDVMYSNTVHSVKPTDNYEEVADAISKYDLLAIPVVDDIGRLLGIVTVDDIIDVLEDETTEDFYNLGAAGQPIKADYLSASVLTMARNRITWLVCLVLVGFVSGFIMEKYTAMLNSMVVLTFFIPLLCASGGNAGSQTTTIIIRSLATGEIDGSKIMQVLFKEFQVGLIVGVILGIFAALRALLMNHDLYLGITVALAMVATIVIAKSIGAILPLLIDKVGLDPAIMSAPLISTILDVTTLLVYFNLAGMIMTAAPK